MQIGSVKDTAVAVKLHPLFTRVFHYLSETDLLGLPLGETRPQGECFFLIVSEFQGHKAEDVPLETHLKHIDIQLPLQGSESMGWLPASQCLNVQEDYTEASDCALYRNKPNKYVTLFPGEFVVFFPEDAHAPGISNGVIRKLVVKIPV